MKYAVVLSCLVMVAHVCADPLSCMGITPRLTHDGHGFQIHTPLINGANAVDAHVEFAGATDTLNVRMIPSATEPDVYELPEAIIGNENAPIRFHFTFMAPAAQACDTIQFGRGDQAAQASAQAATAAAAAAPEMASEANSVPAETAACTLPPIEHQVLQNQPGQYIVQVTGPQPYSYIDLHATIGSSPESNLRLGADVATVQSAPMSIPAGESLTYQITYAANGVQCNTGMFATGPLN